MPFTMVDQPGRVRAMSAAVSAALVIPKTAIPASTCFSTGELFTPLPGMRDESEMDAYHEFLDEKLRNKRVEAMKDTIAHPENQN